MVSLRDQELIDRFLDDLLTNEEKALFVHNFNTSEEFALEVRKNSDARTALQSVAATQELIKDSVRKTLIHSLHWSWQVAAVVMILIGTGLTAYFLFYRYSLNPEELYAENYNPPPEWTVFRHSDLQDQHSGAAPGPGFDRDSSAESCVGNQDSSAARFFTGIRRMEEKKFVEALACFDVVLKDGTSEYVEEADWYKGLSLLKLSRPAACRKQFEKIAKTDNAFQKRAKDILKRMPY